jgi:hypothetical protein
MHLRLIIEVVTRLRQDPAFRDRVATDPEGALAGIRLRCEERRALAALSRQPEAVTALKPLVW